MLRADCLKRPVLDQAHYTLKRVQKSKVCKDYPNKSDCNVAGGYRPDSHDRGSRQLIPCPDHGQAHSVDMVSFYPRTDLW